MTLPEHAVTVRRLIPAGRQRVFDAFSRADALTEWFSPSPEISVEVLAFAFAPEGRFRLRYRMPGDVLKVVEGAFEVIAPPEQLAFSWVWEAPDPHAGVPTRVVVRFLDKGDATEVVLTHERLPSEEAGARHAEGWEGTLDHLVRWLPGAAPASTSHGDARHA